MLDELIRDILIGISVRAQYGQIAKRALTSNPVIGPDGERLLRYSRTLRVLAGVVGPVIASVMLAVLWFVVLTNEDIAVVLFLGPVLGGIAAFMIYGALDAWFTRLVIRADGVVSHVAWRRARRMQWTEIREVAWSNPWQWFVIRDGRGRTIRAGLTLDGLRALHRELKRRVPSDYWTSSYAPFENQRSSRAKKKTSTAPRSG